MDTPIKLAAAAACIVYISAVSCAGRKSEPTKQKQFVTTSQSVVNGEKMFMTYCQKCHPAGEAGLGPAINSNPAPQFLKRFQVRHGLGVMPSFKQEQISTADLHDISAYLKLWKNY